jgi:hypothetical protein
MCERILINSPVLKYEENLFRSSQVLVSVHTDIHDERNLSIISIFLSQMCNIMTQHRTLELEFKAYFTHKQNTFPWQPSYGCGWSATNFAVIFVVQATAHCYICQFYLVATSYKTVSVPREKTNMHF